MQIRKLKVVSSFTEASLSFEIVIEYILYVWVEIYTYYILVHPIYLHNRPYDYISKTRQYTLARWHIEIDLIDTTWFHCSCLHLYHSGNLNNHHNVSLLAHMVLIDVLGWELYHRHCYKIRQLIDIFYKLKNKENTIHYTGFSFSLTSFQDTI